MSENIVLTFTEIDDAVTVYLNGNAIVSHQHGSPLRHTMTPLTVDLGSHLVEGRNTLRIEAENGPASAALVGFISGDGEEILSWKERPGHVGRGVFYDETFELFYQHGRVQHRQIVHAGLVFTEIDDYVTVLLNDHEIYSTKGERPLRYNQDPLSVEITASGHPVQKGRNALRIVATNGPGSAAFVGQIRGKSTEEDEVVIHSWKHHPGHVGKGDFVDETFYFDFKNGLVTFLF